MPICSARASASCSSEISLQLSATCPATRRPLLLLFQQHLELLVVDESQIDEDLADASCMSHAMSASWIAAVVVLE